MRTRNSPHDSRSSGSVHLRTPGRHEQSPCSVYSSSSSSSKKSSYRRNPVKIAAMSVAGAFVACFTPPETKIESKFGDSNEYPAPSVIQFLVASDASSGGSVKKHGSIRGIYASSNKSTRTSEPGSVKFTMEEIHKATKNFSPTLKIGQGGFGTVYKGRLEDGTVVAIKRAKQSVYDKHLGQEFQSEIRTLAQVEHLNLVRYYGYLEHEDERIVVVEYVPNGTLRDHLDYHPIIHRDIKSSNILLTENLRAKVADFGFSRLAADSDATHVSTQVKGTAGYLDPEYLRTYQLTEKSDVYSFGVLLVELVTGRRPIEPKREKKERITTRWAIKNFTDGDAILVLDPRLDRSRANNLALEKTLELALRCLAPYKQNRPTMRRCAEILWSVRKDYRELSASDTQSLSSHSLTSGSIREE
ncbi:calmodulin-binding receptor-like cytoplasmic kinase 2 isoform X5 [Rhododendron vialii]|uniref:calmodulin-binding receptor-like cytoplasmic kinase 2 isoform X5 n=1 Tax=Rhododendron vialii TaxID=182163 RepID=UPI00265D8382|nr:calmodulin-binding receptor-like cytoplasmic kinase 2 isoform X5 [Rhododendron vialii]